MFHCHFLKHNWCARTCAFRFVQIPPIDRKTFIYVFGLQWLVTKKRLYTCVVVKELNKSVTYYLLITYPWWMSVSVSDGEHTGTMDRGIMDRGDRWWHGGGRLHCPYCQYCSTAVLCHRILCQYCSTAVLCHRIHCPHFASNGAVLLPNSSLYLVTGPGQE